MNKNYQYVLLAILVLSIAINVVTCRQKSKAKTELSEVQSILDVSQDSLEKSRDDYNRQVARAKGLELESWKMLKETQTQDSIIDEMTKIIKENKRVQDVSVISSETSITKTLPTVIKVRELDTIYVTKYEDKWIKLENVTDRDSSSFQLSVQNSFYTWSQFGKRKGVFGRRDLDVFVRSENPYTDLNRVEKFTIKQPKQRRLGFGLFGGYGINSRGEVGTQAGVGLIYRLR